MSFFLALESGFSFGESNMEVEESVHLVLYPAGILNLFVRPLSLFYFLFLIYLIFKFILDMHFCFSD